MQFGASFVLDKLKLTELLAIKEIGLDFVELYIGDYWNDLNDLELQLIAVREILDLQDLFCIIHLSHLNSQLIIDSDLWINYVDLLSEQIKIIGKLGLTKQIVFHGVFGGTEDPSEISSKDIFNIKLKAINEWLIETQKSNMNLLLENTDESESDLANVFKKQPRLDFAFDIGHANISFSKLNNKISKEQVFKIFKTFKNKICHMHFHDNFGGVNESADLHLSIGSGSINFERILEELSNVNYNKTITLEIYNPLYHFIYLEASLKVIKKIISNQKESTE